MDGEDRHAEFSTEDFGQGAFPRARYACDDELSRRSSRSSRFEYGG
ncbi:hypothetical protein IWX65_000626 [Arthrobacter sp. CAN_A214]